MKKVSKEYSKNEKKVVENLNNDEIEFPVQELDFNQIQLKNNIYINVFGYENGLLFPIYLSDQTFGDSMNSLLIIYVGIQWGNSIGSSLFQFSNKRSSKTHILIRKFSSINFIHD